jgi:hypothetical protein
VRSLSRNFTGVGIVNFCYKPIFFFFFFFFFALCNLFRGRGLVPETSCYVEEQIAMFLHVVGHNKRFRVVHRSFRRSIETVSRVFHQVLYAVGELRTDMIKPPTTGTHPKIMGSQR